MTEDETFGWHHRLNGHGFEQAPGDGEGQGSLVCCGPWGGKESDAIQPSHPLSSPSSPAFNHSQHQDLFQRVSSSNRVAKVLEFQLQSSNEYP